MIYTFDIYIDPIQYLEHTQKSSHKVRFKQWGLQ